MIKRNIIVVACAVVGLALGLVGYGLQADEFTDKDVERWQGEFMSVVEEGRALWGSGGPRDQRRRLRPVPPQCRQHPPRDLSQVPETAGRVIAFREMINWCLMNPLEGETLELDDPRDDRPRGLRHLGAPGRGTGSRQTLRNSLCQKRRVLLHPPFLCRAYSTFSASTGFTRVARSTGTVIAARVTMIIAPAAAAR